MGPANGRPAMTDLFNPAPPAQTWPPEPTQNRAVDLAVVMPFLALALIGFGALLWGATAPLLAFL
jgi:hypothetical protein